MEESRTTSFYPRWFPMPGIRFEFVEGGDGGGAGGEGIVPQAPPPEPAPAAPTAPEPAPPVAVVPEPAAPAAPEPGADPELEPVVPPSPLGLPTTREELAALVREGSQGALLELLTAAETPPAAGPQLPDYDPFNPEIVQQYAQHGIQQILERELGPVRELLGAFAEREGEARANSELDTIEADLNKDVPEGQPAKTFNRDRVVVQASALIDRGVKAEDALRYAAEQDLAYRDSLREELAKELGVPLNNMHRVHSEPPVAPAAATEFTETEARSPDRYKLVARSAAARAGRGLGVVSPTG